MSKSAEELDQITSWDNQGPRYARVCGSDPKAGCPWREFENPKARCPEHGSGKDQPDRKYRGRKTPVRA